MNKLLIFIMLVTFLAIEKSFMSEVDNMKLEFVQTVSYFINLFFSSNFIVPAI